MVDDRRLNVMLNGELLEIDCVNYFGSYVTVDGGMDVEVRCSMNTVGKVLGGISRIF